MLYIFKGFINNEEDHDEETPKNEIIDISTN